VAVFVMSAAQLFFLPSFSEEILQCVRTGKSSTTTNQPF
jgi:hypothetical protein